MIIENNLLDLEKEYNIHKILRHNWDSLACLLAIFVVLAIGNNNPVFLTPIILLLMLYVVMDENYTQTSERNSIRTSYALKQNNFYELVYANALDYMDKHDEEQNKAYVNTRL